MKNCLFAYSLPTLNLFLFLSCSTRYARDGQDTPAGAVIDVDGNQLTDSKLILKRMVEKKAALTPLGGAGDAMGG